MPSAMELEVELGPMPADALDGAAVEGGGLRGLLDRKEFCDVILVVGEQSFMAHSLVLGAVSPCFHAQIQQEQSNALRRLVPGLGWAPITIHLGSVSHPEAVQDMLTCIYGQSAADSTEPLCRTDVANRDVLQLAQTYHIPQLQEQASRWLTHDLTTQNVLCRLHICEQFGLIDVRETILEQLLADPIALPMLAQDPEIIKVPKVLQDLLLRILSLVNNGAAFDANPQQANVKQGKTAGRPRRAGA